MTKYARGLTILELMMTIVVLAIIVGLAVPTLNEFRAQNLVSSTTNHLVTTFNLARSEAVTRRAVVRICSSDNGTSCKNDSWNTGWLVFVDDDADGALDNGEAVLSSSTLSVPLGIIESSGADGVSFTILGSSAEAAQRSFRFCHNKTGLLDFCTQVSVRRSGNISSQKVSSS